MLVALWKRRTALLVVLSILVLASFALSVNWADSAPVANFYSPVSRFWEPGAGCMLALAMERPNSAAPTQSSERCFLDIGCNILALAGVALIVASIVEFDATTAFPGLPALLPVLGTLLILATPESAWFHRRVLGSRPLVWTGLISYALYLWHWPLLSFLNILEAGRPPVAIRWIALGLSFLLAWITYRWIETPIRRRKSLKINIGLAAAAAAAGTAGLVVFGSGGVTQRFDSDIQALRHGPRRDELCYTRFAAAAPINYCRTTSAQPPSILFVGDSRAHAIYEVAAPLLASAHSVMLLGRGGCPPLLNVRVLGYDPNEKDCEHVWQTFIRYAHQAKPKVVVIVGNGSFLITHPKIQLIRHGATAVESREAVFEYGIRSLLTELTRFSRVIYLGEIPAFSTGPSCFLRAVRLPTTECYPERDREQVELAMAPYNRVMNRVQMIFPQVQMVDAVAVLCAANVCSQRPPGKPVLYSDAVNLSLAGASLLIENTGLTTLISQDVLSADSG